MVFCLNVFSHKDGSAVYQVVVGVTYLLAYDGYGL